MKKIACVLIVSALLIALVACAPANVDDDKYVITDPWWTTTGTLEKDGNGQVVFENVNLSMMTVVNGADYKVLQSILNDFNTAYKGKIRIDVSNTTQENFVKLVSNAVAQNQNPADILMSHQNALQALATDYQCIQPFNEAMEESGINIDLNDYADDLAKYANLGYEGYTFGIPVDAQSMIVLYNKELLGDNALPTNHAEAVALCDTLASSGKKPLVWAAAEETETNFFAEYIWPTALLQNGASLYDESGASVSWGDGNNSTAFQNAITSIRDFKNAGASLSDGKTKATNQFVNGEAVFFAYEPWLVNNVINSFATKKGISVDEAMQNYIGATSISNWFALDANSDTADTIFGDSHFFAMSKSVKAIEKKAAIVEFAKWFTNNVNTAITWAKAGHVTASKTIGASDEYKNDAFISNFTSKFYPDINHVSCAGNTVYYDQIFGELSNLFILLRDDSSKDATYISRSAKAVNDTISALQVL